MAINFLQNINLNKTELQNAIVHPLSTAPASPSEGQIYYDIDDNLLWVYNGAAWDAYISSITCGTGIALVSGTGTEGDMEIALDFGELSVGDTLVATDYLTAENGGSDTRQLISSIPLSIFNNDANWTSNQGDITQVNITAGNGLSGTSVNTTSGAHTQTLTVGAGTGITVNANDVAVNYSGATSVVLGATDGTAITLASTDKFIVADDSDATDTVKYVNFSQLSTALGSYDYSIQADTDLGAGMPYTIASGDTVDIAGDATQGISTEISDSGTTTTITIKGDDATTTTKGVASFNTNDFSVSSGAVSIKTGGVSNTQLVNDSITIGDSTIALGGTDTTLTGLTDIDLTAASHTIFDNVGANTLTIGAGTTTVAIPGDLVVTGTVTTNNVETISTSNGVIFEGNAADANELTLLAGTLTADRTVTLPDATGTVALTSDLHDAVTLAGAYDYITISGQVITRNQIDYTTDIANTPTIPTVNNSTITLDAGNSGITMDVDNSFTLNQASGETITISHADTSSQASVNNTGRTYIQDVTLDDYGHVTALVSATETVTNTDNQLATAAALIDLSVMAGNSTASFTHGLASKNLIVQLYDVTSGLVVHADVDHTSNNAISVIFGRTGTQMIAQGINDIRVVVIDAKNGLTDKTVSYS